MSVRATRRALFLAFVFLVPAPLLVMTSGWMPTASYALFAAVSSLVGIVEGASGVVPALVLMFLAHALVYAGASWLVAWLLARVMGGLSPKVRAALALVAIALGLAVALAWPVYETPFGRAPRGNLVEALT